MTARTQPLELILRAHGPAELVNADSEMLWASDSDDNFKEEFTDEFLQEEDFDEILEYLMDNELLTKQEYNAFKSDRWDCIVETIDTGANGPEEPDDDENDEDWECEGEEEFDDDT